MPEQATTHVDPQLLSKAMTALMKHHDSNASETSLLGDEKTLLVQFSLNRVPESASPKPIPILLPHALYKLDDDAEGVQEPEVCIIVKEDSKAWVQEMIQQFPEHLGFVKKVLGLTSLRKKHARYEQQRDLLARYDVFMADDRILPMLAKCIGRNFFQAKKQPIPIRLTRKQALPFVILQSLKSTHLFISEGTCITIRAGNTAMPLTKLIENVATIVESAPLKFPRKWSNVRSISIKTSSSMALPIYNKTPEELAEITKMAGIEEVVDEQQLALEEEQNKVTKSEKKKRKAKSPLVKALNQMEGSSEPEAQEGPTSKRAKTVQQKTTIKKVVDGNHTPTEAPMVAANKTLKNRSNEVIKAGSKATEIKAGKEKTNKTAKKAPKVEKAIESMKEQNETSTKANESEVVVKGMVDKAAKVVNKDMESKRKRNESNEKTTDLKAKSEKKVRKDTEDKQEFIVAAKFKGSKTGYVFRKGPQGVGYYVDIKPVVDKIAMQALIRMGKSSPGGGNGGSGKKGKRGRR